MTRKARLINIFFLVVICLILVAAGYTIYRYFSSSPPPTPTYSLVDAADQGIISAQFRGRGAASGDSIELKVESEVEFEIEVEIKPGWILINSGSGQNMIVAEKQTITVKPKVELQMTIEAYCLDIELDNPSHAETFSLQEDPGTYREEAAELMRFVATAPVERRSIRAVQIALWVLLDDVTSIPMTHSDSDIFDAKWLLENLGIDVSGRRIFQMAGKSEEEIREMFENEYAASATTINMVLTTEDFEITVVKMGMFSRYAYGDIESTFRLDLKVKNIGIHTERFSAYYIKLIAAEGLSYEWSHGTIKSVNIVGGEMREGYLLFDEVPETATIAKLVVDEVYIFDFEKNEAYSLMEVYENMYQQSAITVEQTITEGDFSITLLKVGHFTHLEFDTGGDEVTEFRVDLEVTSIASEPEYIFESDIVIIDNLGNQYDYEYGGTLDLGEIYPGVTREGYVLFPTLDENATSITVIVTDTAYPEDFVYEFTVNLE